MKQTIKTQRLEAHLIDPWTATILVSLRAIDMDDLRIHALNVSWSGPQ